MTADELVDRLLEYGSESEYAERPGGSADPWRKGEFKKFKFTAKDFLGRRSGAPADEPGEKEDEDKDEDKDKDEPKSRFKWTPS